MRPGLAIAVAVATGAFAAIARADEPIPSSFALPADPPSVAVETDATLAVAAGAPAPSRPTIVPRFSPRLVWDERWPRFRVIEYGTTAAAFEMLGFIELKFKRSQQPNFTGGILFDDALRDVFRLHSRAGRINAGHVADALALATEIEPIFASTVPPLLDGLNVDVAWQMITIDLEAQAFTGLSQRTLMYAFKRARPYYFDCKRDKSYASCSSPTASFPSGHSSSAFAGAGSSCAHHLHLPLYGGGAPDVVVCIAALMAATGAAGSRLLADDHWATDVIVGSSLGFFFGYGFPTLLHYHALLPSVKKRDVQAMLLPDVNEDKVGAKIIGAF